MPQALGSGLAKNSLRCLMGQAEREQNLSADDARELGAECKLAAVILQTLWQSFQEFLGQGMEGEKALSLIGDLQEVATLALKAFDAAHEKLSHSALPATEKADSAAAVMILRRGALEKHDELSSLQAWLETPRPKIEVSSLPGNRGEQAAAGYVDLDTLTARLLSGRDD